MQVADIENKLSKFLYELETEDRLVRVGLKDELQSADIFKKYEDLFSQKTLNDLSAILASSNNQTDREIVERLYFTIASSFVGNKLAREEDKLKTYFSKAEVSFKGEKIPYYELSVRSAKEKDYIMREVYDKLAVCVVKAANTKQAKMLLDIVALIKSLGFSSYLDYHQKSKKVDYGNFIKVVESILKQTDELWQNNMNRVSREVFGRPFKNVKSVHMGHLRSLSSFDSFYPKDRVMPSFIRLAKELGMEDLLKSIQVDDEARPKKNPRAVCYWPNPPKEIHLVIKPIGGEQDFEAALHEGGHALHGAAVSGKLPFTFKALSRSNALTEAYAFILEDLVFEPAFLDAYLGVSKETATKIKRQAIFVNLMMLRRYLGKFRYEYKMFTRDDFKNGPSLYAKSLDTATGFVHHSENWLMDMDDGFYSADYLRAWIASAQIKDYINFQFGNKWFTNLKAGKFLRGLFEEGVKYDLEEVVSRLGYTPFDTSYLVNNYEKVLV